MKKSIWLTIMVHEIVVGSVRNIFMYDLDWKHVEYEIIAQGHLHCGNTRINVLQCGSQTKIVIKK